MEESKKKKSKKQISRSIKLRKYGKIYDSLSNTQQIMEKSPRRHRPITKRKSRRKIEKEEEKKRPLTDYNKFIRNESKKEIYENMSSRKRLKQISEKWKLKKKNI
jgi:hypothetical protein